MRLRISIGLAALAVVSLLAAGGAAPASASTICTWGGTPAAPTGVVTLTPGVTNVPASEPLRLKATGDLAGGGPCSGKLTFHGEANAGSTCEAISFEGTVDGLPGVARFWGPGLFGIVNEFLYDESGNLVGADQPQVLTRDNAPHFSDCTLAPDGFTGGTFSSTVELF
jgi:hypothetical protein